MRVSPFVLAAFASLATLSACGAAGPPSPTPAPPGAQAAAAAQAEFAAARYVPANPSYLLAAPSFADAQHALATFADLVTLPAGVSRGEIARELTALLGVDPLDANATAGIGIDPTGGFAVFSEDLAPTFVVHLAGADMLWAFVDRQRKLGFKTRSAIVDGVELFSAKVTPGLAISWAVDHDWLWLHFAVGDPTDTTWFTHSHTAGAPAWLADWRDASQRMHGLGVAGFARLGAIWDVIAKRAPEAIACARAFSPVRRVAVGFDADPHLLGVHVAFELGDAVKGVAAKLVPPPPGWERVAAAAPISAQWNVDGRAAIHWLEPCAKTVMIDLAALVPMNAYAARTIITSFDPGGDTDISALRNATGAVSLELPNAGSLSQLLDQVPMRSRLESPRTFGSYRGYHLAVPFTFTLDYVLDGSTAIAALGDGVLDKLAALPAGPVAMPPLVALDLHPTRLTASAWSWLLHQMTSYHSDAAVQRFLSWDTFHLALRLDGDAVVLEVSGKHT